MTIAPIDTVTRLILINSTQSAQCSDCDKYYNTIRDL